VNSLRLNLHRQFLSRILPVLLSGLIFFSVSSGALALEGYYTEEEVRTFAPAGGPDNVVIRKSWYADDRMRKDEGWMGITIARFDLDCIYILEPRSRTYVEISPEFLAQYSPRGLKAFGAQEDERGVLYFPDDLYIRTETTKKIGLWNCYQVVTNPRYRSPKAPYVVLWYSTEVEFPVHIFTDQLRRLFGKSPAAEGLFNRLTQFEGYPVRTEAHGPAANVITTLIRIQRQKDMNPEQFEVPADYTKEIMPEEIPGLRWDR